MADAALPRGRVLGVPVTVCTFAAAVDWLAAAVEQRRAAFLCHANVYSLMLARRDPAHRRRLAAADLVAADGMPVVWALRLLGHRGAQRVHGDDLFFALCRRLADRRHFLLGGAAGQSERVAAELERRFPGLRVAGCRSTPVRPLPAAQTRRALAEIEASGADVVWVGMGTPAQDAWMAAHADAAGRPLIGVGSAFDLLAGRTRPAPGWMKRSGLQWLFRLAQEPRRLWRRYLVNNPLFVACLLLEWSGLKRFDDDGDDSGGGDDANGDGGGSRP